MLAALLQGGSRWQNLPECYGTVTIRIQETDNNHRRHKWSDYWPACLLGSQCNLTVDRVGHRQRLSIAACSFLSELLGKRVCRAVIFWYVLTGFDTVSQFLWCGKPTAWKPMKAFPEVTDTFIKLSWSGAISTEDFKMIEHIVILMHVRTCPHKTVDKCCKYLFTQMNCKMGNCPSTRDA